MKVTIEIPDEKMKHILETAIQAKIAEITNEYIKTKVNDIMRVKLDRIKEYQIGPDVWQHAINEHVSSEFSRMAGGISRRHDYLSKLVGEAIAKLIAKL